MTNSAEHIVPGISLSPSGQATIDSSLNDLLFDLAIACEASSGLPVDIQHVVAAVIMASRHGQLDPLIALTADDPALLDTLVIHLRTIFLHHDGKLSPDD